MYHSITIGDKDTWDDWHMIPVTPPVIAPPVEKTISLDVEGRNGAVYLSKSVTGEAVFKARRKLGVLSGYRILERTVWFLASWKTGAGSSCKSTERRHRKADEAVCAAGG